MSKCPCLTIGLCLKKWTSPWVLMLMSKATTTGLVPREVATTRPCSSICDVRARAQRSLPLFAAMTMRTLAAIPLGASPPSPRQASMASLLKPPTERGSGPPLLMRSALTNPPLRSPQREITRLKKSRAKVGRWVFAAVKTTSLGS